MTESNWMRATDLTSREWDLIRLTLAIADDYLSLWGKNPNPEHVAQVLRGRKRSDAEEEKPR